jgi:hypothetical protein
MPLLEGRRIEDSHDGLTISDATRRVPRLSPTSDLPRLVLRQYRDLPSFAFVITGVEVREKILSW